MFPVTFSYVSHHKEFNVLVYVEDPVTGNDGNEKLTNKFSIARIMGTFLVDLVDFSFDFNRLQSSHKMEFSVLIP